VPRDVSDGEYTIRVRIVDVSGAQRWTEIPITIDAKAPELAVAADELAIPGEPFHITVDPQEPVREVVAYVAQHKRSRVELRLDTETGLYQGDLMIPTGLDRDELTIRIVARDLARNRVDDDLVVPMLTAPDCCEDEEEQCRL
jgi:hypothetical protein